MLGALEVLKALKKAWQFLGAVWENYTDYTQAQAASLNAVGWMMEAEGTVMPGSVGVGYNIMFFPETCEIATFTYLIGTTIGLVEKGLLISQPGGGWVDGPSTVYEESFLEGLGIFGGGVSIGFSVGGVVSAQPLGSGPHDAASWLGWFFSSEVSGGLLTYSAFANSNWEGITISAGLSLPGASVKGAYYDYIGADPATVLDLKDDGCACKFFRNLVGLVSPGAWAEVIFGALLD